MKDGFRAIAISDNGYTLMNHAWKVSGVSKSPPVTVINATMGWQYFTFEKLTDAESEFELTLQVTNPDQIVDGNMLFFFMKRWNNEILAEKLFAAPFKTKTKDIEGNALSLALGWGVDTPMTNAEDANKEAYDAAAAFP